jgi:hypothetical protein
MGLLELEESVRKRVTPVALGAVSGYIGNQSFEEQEKKSVLTMFQIISGTVGVEPTPQLDTYGQGQEIRDIFERTLPFNMPIVVLGSIRMVIEEYITNKSMSEIDYDEFDKSDAREIVNALMNAVEIVNTRCIQEPKNIHKMRSFALPF